MLVSESPSNLRIQKRFWEQTSDSMSEPIGHIKSVLFPSMFLPCLPVLACAVGGLACTAKLSVSTLLSVIESVMLVPKVVEFTVSEYNVPQSFFTFFSEGAACPFF